MISSVFLLIGSVIILLSAYGVFKHNEVLEKMQYATLMNTSGVLLVLIGTAIHFATVRTEIQTVLIGLGILIIMPLSSHLIAVFVRQLDQKEKN